MRKLVKESQYSEIVTEWLKDLYSDELEDTIGAIENERIWQNGADDDEGIDMHENNIQDLEEYAEVLQNLIDDLG